LALVGHALEPVTLGVDGLQVGKGIGPTLGLGHDVVNLSSQADAAALPALLALAGVSIPLEHQQAQAQPGIAVPTLVA
jgi:hypothetical protein